MKITDYKGYEIFYDSFSRRFYVGGMLECFVSQDEAENYIDKLIKMEKSEFKKIPAISRLWGELTLGEVTGIIDGKDAWFRSEEGKRNKIQLKYLNRATSDNLELLRQHRELSRQINDLSIKRLEIKFGDCLAEEETK